MHEPPVNMLFWWWTMMLKKWCTTNKEGNLVLISTFIVSFPILWSSILTLICHFTQNTKSPNHTLFQLHQPKQFSTVWLYCIFTIGFPPFWHTIQLDFTTLSTIWNISQKIHLCCFMFWSRNTPIIFSSFDIVLIHKNWRGYLCSHASLLKQKSLWPKVQCHGQYTNWSEVIAHDYLTVDGSF